MRTFIALVRRELASFFLSWTGYVIIAAVLFLLGFSFHSMLRGLNGEPTPVPITQLFYGTLYFWLVLLVASPIITMRSLALEKSSGTYETLMTTPISEGRVVLAKFSGALLFFMVMWLPLLGCLLIVRHYTSDPTAFDWGCVGSTYLGILLVGSLYMSIGIFASAITRSQIIAAMVTFAIGLSVFMLSFLSSAFASEKGWMAALVTHVALMEHMRDFSQGVVDTRPVVFYVTMTLFFLHLTLKCVESRRWK
jgi:ABC-2 type transport system permease protein